VLLKNEGGLLPLDRERIRKIAVIGPNADDARTRNSACAHRQGRTS
jgi:beta-glucosidase